MNLILFSLVILISFSTILAFADSETEKKLLYDKAIKFLQLGELEEASFYFDKVLEIDPNHIGALNNKGSLLTLLGKPYEATSYFYNVLTIEPNHEFAKIGFDNAKAGLLYHSIDGIVEVTVRDDQGRLVTYERTSYFRILDHEVVNQTISDIFAKKVITRNGQDIEAFQLKIGYSINKDGVRSQWGITTIYNPNTLIIYALSHQIPLVKGDEVKLVFTIFNLPE